jgi:predicted DNA-binding transcriptional regulator AlpA
MSIQRILYCCFCGKNQYKVEQLVVGKECVGICNACVNLCIDILNKRKDKSEQPKTRKDETKLEDLLTSTEAAKLLKVSKAWMERKRWAKEPPEYIKVSPRCVRYRKQDLLEYVNNRVKKGGKCHE